MVELDHIFICVREGAPEGDALVEWGWTEGTPNVHEELGTANRRFYTHNFMLELLYVRDPRAVEGDTTFALEQRFAGASPFGVCLRCEAPDEPLPFDAVPMEFGFLPGHVAARIGRDATQGDPRRPCSASRGSPGPSSIPAIAAHPSSTRRVSATSPVPG